MTKPVSPGLSPSGGSKVNDMSDEEWRARQLEIRIDTALKLHQCYGSRKKICALCAVPWPCPTVVALDPENEKPGG
jgi:hypothetical protein